MKVAKEALGTTGGSRRLQDETEASSESTDAVTTSGEPGAESENTGSSESETATATEGETAAEAEGTTTGGEGGAAEATDGQ